MPSASNFVNFDKVTNKREKSQIYLGLYLSHVVADDRWFRMKVISTAIKNLTAPFCNTVRTIEFSLAYSSNPSQR